MFETVAPETFQTPSRRLFYETLPVSIAIHAIGIGAAVVAAVWNVAFPTVSPRVSVAYSLAAIPDPPPPPPPLLPKQSPAEVEPPKPVVLPPSLMKLGQMVAPTVIPDKIPEVVPMVPDPPPPPPPVTATAAGMPNGSHDGELGGDIAGKIAGKAGGIVFPDGRLHIDRSEKLPMESVEQEYPRYPAEAQKRRLEDQVVVRYIIGTDGRVKSVEIIDHAREKMFDEAAIDAIRRWRFRPMIKDGKRVEVVHELAVNFEIVIR